MKAIIDGKLYDTDTAEKVYSFRRKHVEGSVFLPTGTGFVEWHDITVYKTAKGAYFETEEYKDGRIQFAAIEETYVREVMARLDPEQFIQIFGQVDEA